jgi:Holliday junction resolvase RusA-like endonuclease
LEATIKIKIEMPWERNLSVNASHFGPGGHYRRKSDVQAWMRTLAWRIKAEIIGIGYLLPFQVTVDFQYPDGRKRDDHNYYKVLVDAVASGLGIDDKDIRISTGTIVVDPSYPGFRIMIEDKEEK